MALHCRHHMLCDWSAGTLTPCICVVLSPGAMRCTGARRAVFQCDLTVSIEPFLPEADSTLYASCSTYMSGVEKPQGFGVGVRQVGAWLAGRLNREAFSQVLLGILLLSTCLLYASAFGLTGH